MNCPHDDCPSCKISALATRAADLEADREQLMEALDSMARAAGFDEWREDRTKALVARLTPVSL